LGLLTALPGLLLTTLLTALSRLLTLLARLLLSAATLLATLTALLTALVLPARFLFVRIHKCSFVGLPTDNETMAIKFPFDFGTQAYTRRSPSRVSMCRWVGSSSVEIYTANSPLPLAPFDHHLVFG
jgi:hypothetical protein